ncbi:probable disease resistance protein RF9 [Gastrolobium bilobum]|uniref:probable disease resistance protein RF9 n=1 Tax=Gastrolobium bilobum TaxID=150636 RepID=UPI002AB20E45|nr:probable disease resistance protein RF9 [Gastrolobium bilobum]
MNKNGSRIIITTRDMRVASCCKKYPNSHVLVVQPLSPEKSLELFLQKAGIDLTECFSKDLMGICSEIVKKCEGLPVALVAIGQYLCMLEKEKHVWTEFSQKLSSNLEKNSHLTAIKAYLDTSYHDLPYRLKQCLLYFGIYQKIESKRLIRQWIAEGFIKYETGETLEQTAEIFLTELIQRNLVQVSSFGSNGKTRICHVHGLVHDMILKKIAYSGFCHFVRENGDSSASDHRNFRRLTIATISKNLIKTSETPVIWELIRSKNKQERIRRAQYTRSLHILTEEELPDHFVRSIPTIYSRLKVLDFEGAPLYNVPEYLGVLSYLRYLSFRNTEVQNLPRSIGRLHSLETLDLRQTGVREVPKEINNLKKLRHLLAYGPYNGYGIRMNDGIGALESLQTLREVKTGLGGGNLIEELGSLTQLRELGLTAVWGEFTSSLCSSINKMQHLEKLYIAAAFEDEVIDLDCDVYAPVLRKLLLRGKLDPFPKWVLKLPNLVKLSLSYSKLTHDPLTTLGHMPNLLYLSILINRALEGECLHFRGGGFQKLKQLVLKSLGDLDSIVIDTGALPSLEKFTLVKTPKLKEVPLGIYNLPNLLYLSIFYGAFHGECLHFRGGGFQKLKQLELKSLYDLDSIVIDTGALPSLEKFTLVNIPQLKEVPLGIYNLPKLEVHIMDMPDEFVQSIDHDGGQQKWIIEEVQEPYARIVKRFWE